jgi:hypothetical protein
MHSGNKLRMVRRSVGKLNNELSIVNQLVDLHFLLFVNITGNGDRQVDRFIEKFVQALI